MLLLYRLYQPTSLIVNDLQKELVVSVAISSRAELRPGLSPIKLTRFQYDKHQQKRVKQLRLSSLILLLSGDI